MAKRRKADTRSLFDGIDAGYGDAHVLHDIGLALSPGSVTALLGANGSGKSTLCRTISGLITPSQGTINLRSVDITRQAAPLRARDDIIVVPESRGIFPGLTVDENLSVRLRQASARAKVYERFPVLGERGTRGR